MKNGRSESGGWGQKRFKERLVWSGLKWAGHLDGKGDENFALETLRGKGGEKYRVCDEWTALREICKEWDENGEQQQKTERIVEW